ncbi:hypothetical protein Ahy_A01g002060 [Arachis hypogaea]|uniref:SWIM-type domain-containing protein n=1 Tax=Arachis hypogaea TaxID=3818 RepID=A0A445EQ07_ARAHY|nr:hypothetical protein Ahy_A01g002060 [Arachis hypogaea]
MDEQYQVDDDINQQEELVCGQDMMDEQNEFEQDFRDEFTEGAKNCAEKIGKYHFSTLQLAFDFYLKYSKSKGFSARKSKTFKNSISEIYKQKFARIQRGEILHEGKKRKKEPRLKIRTGCKVRMDVKFVSETGRWHIFYFSDKHNHDLLDTQSSSMLPAHRKMSEADIMQMINMLKSGIITSQIFGLLASQAGGYEFVSYGLRDMYNEITRQRRQVQLLEEFGLEDKPCVNNMYEEKHMWATAYIRGKFFADFRTTSRCEGLHSVVAMYVRSRCVAHLHFKEFNADYKSTRGVPVIVGSMRVLNIENNDDCIKYIVCKHGRPDFMWTVEFCQEEMIFMCTCLRMESFGIPCEHIVKVLDEREICEIFWSLVLNRWTKKVKSALNDASGFTRDAVVISHQSALMEFSKQLVVVATKVPKRYEETRDIIMGLYSSYKAADEGTNQPQSSVAKSSNLYMHQTNIGSGQPSKKKRQRCNVCQMEGHKKTACPWEKDIDNNVIEDEANGSDDGDMYTEPTADLDSDN